MACPVRGESCTLFECAANCTNTDVKAVSSEILQLAAQASNASIALSYARPLLECNFVVDKLLGAMSDCNELRRGPYAWHWLLCWRTDVWSGHLHHVPRLLHLGRPVHQKG
ncbi:hypothetical protein TcBrA4_0010150 [Trypanosoma cruzi]|nr:hypothetical protein TcBrA4_0010150 [Trypanosoma cruzi]